MDRRKTASRIKTTAPVRRDPFAPVRPHLVPLTFAASIGLALTLLTPFLPVQHLLPAMSLAALAGGGAVALYARLRRPHIRPDAINAWDVSGAFVLIGFACGMASEPDQILSLFGYPAAST